MGNWGTVRLASNLSEVTQHLGGGARIQIQGTMLSIIAVFHTGNDLAQIYTRIWCKSCKVKAIEAFLFITKLKHVIFCLGEDSEDDSDFSESEDNDKDFTMRKSKEIKKKEMKVKSPVVKKEKKAKSKCNSLGKLSLKHIYKENVIYLMSFFYLCLWSP